MFLVTNRNVQPGKPGLEKFGDKPNPNGPNELRLARAEQKGGAWDAEILSDRLSPAQKKQLGLLASRPAFASQYVAHHLLDRVQGGNRNLLLFVHGFNNDVEAVLDRAEKISALYGVEVVPFTWPANGGGVRGVASYKSDKRDARASAGALNRVFEKAHELLEQINRDRLAKIRADARKKHANNQENQDRYFAEESQKGCPFTVNLMLHSMGNYVFKQVMSSSVYEGHRLLFDNVIMVAADVNSHDHAKWVDRINCRRRTYITINEDDSALRASRIKSGEEQLARLGHYPHNLNSRHAVYVDFTNAPEADGSHAYFEDATVTDKNSDAFKFFTGALNGKRVEQEFDYDGAKNLYRVN